MRWVMLPNFFNKASALDPPIPGSLPQIFAEHWIYDSLSCFDEIEIAFFLFVVELYDL
jgi:hypothetical protein